jgi:hypothetical protein
MAAIIKFKGNRISIEIVQHSASWTSYALTTDHGACEIGAVLFMNLKETHTL